MFPNSRRKLSLLPADDGGRRILARSESSATMVERQSGHERFDWSHVSMHSAWKAWQQSGRRRRRSWWWNFERHTAQSPETAAERRVTEENVKSGSVSITEAEAEAEEWSISGEMRRLEAKIGVAAAEGAAEEEEKRRRQRRLRWRRRKQRARETMTVTARTVTIIRMLGLRFCNGDERRGDGGVNELVTVGNVLVSWYFV